MTCTCRLSTDLQELGTGQRRRTASISIKEDLVALWSATVKAAFHGYLASSARLFSNVMHSLPLNGMTSRSFGTEMLDRRRWLLVMLTAYQQWRCSGRAAIRHVLADHISRGLGIEAVPYLSLM